MSQKKTNKKKKTKIKLKRDWSFYVVIVCAVIIAIPMLFIGIQVINATRNSGNPVLGNRFLNDLDPAIKQEEIDEIVGGIKEIEGVESAFAELKTATLRVYVLMPEANEEALKNTASLSYDAVMETLDKDVYFTIQDVQKQYDLEIHVYNQLEVTAETTETYVYVLQWKSSNMADPRVQVLSTPLSQEVVDYFKRIDEENAAQEEEPADVEEDAESESGE